MTTKSITILGIESSCDETAAAVSVNNTILSNVIASQSVHEQYGGVIPELASRIHQQNIIPVVDAALKQANKTLADIDAIAFTQGPGLIGALHVGVAFAKGVSLSLNKPLIAVNHMRGHILAHFIQNLENNAELPEFPFLCLTVSGGHTQVVLIKNYLEMEMLATTIDDAAGECFDKIAKVIGLPYPGGPVLDKLTQSGNPKAFVFPLPKVRPNYSFSGLKTAFLYFIKDQVAINPNFISENLNDLCASIQYTIVKYLVRNLLEVAKENNIKTLAISGGVSANSGLRTALQNLVPQYKIFIPKFEYCTDNAAMIAVAGYYMYLNNEFSNLTVTPTAKFSI